VLAASSNVGTSDHQKKIEDIDHYQAVYLVRHGFGSWNEIAAMSQFDRITLFYASHRLDGHNIDWASGEILPLPKPGYQ